MRVLLRNQLRKYEREGAWARRARYHYLLAVSGRDILFLVVFIAKICFTLTSVPVEVNLSGRILMKIFVLFSTIRFQ